MNRFATSRLNQRRQKRLLCQCLTLDLWSWNCGPSNSILWAIFIYSMREPVCLKPWPVWFGNSWRVSAQRIAATPPAKIRTLQVETWRWQTESIPLSRPSFTTSRYWSWAVFQPVRPYTLPGKMNLFFFRTVANTLLDINSVNQIKVQFLIVDGALFSLH